MADDLNVGSVSVDVVPDTTNFRRDLAAKLRGITANIGITTDAAKARDELDEAARDRESTIEADADTTKANTELDHAARNRKATISVETLGLRNFSLLGTAVLGLGPALVPVTAAVAGLGAALAAPVAAAGAGLGIGGFLAGKEVKQTEQQKKQIDQLKKSVDSAKLALTNTQARAAASASNSLATAHASAAASLKSAQEALKRAKTAAQTTAANQRIAAAHASLSAREASIQASQSASVAAAQLKVAQATKAYQAALHGLSPDQAKFLAAQAKLGPALQKLESKSSGALLKPLTSGLNDLAGILPKLAPLIKPVSKAVDGLLTNISGLTKSKGFTNFIKGFGQDAAAAITAFGKIGGNVGTGLFNLFKAFTPLSSDVVSGISSMASSFASWSSTLSTNTGFQKFLAYIQQTGPKVLSVFGNLVGLAVKLGGWLAPLGGDVLGLVGGLASFLRTAKPSTLGAIATAIGGIALAMGKGPLGLSFALAAVLTHSKGVESFLKTAGGYAESFGQWFDKLPSGIKAAAAAMVGVGALSLKVKSLTSGSGGLGGILKIFTKAKPMPVFVTNWEMIRSGGPTGTTPVGGNPKEEPKVNPKELENDKGFFSKIGSKLSIGGLAAGTAALFRKTIVKALTKPVELGDMAAGPGMFFASNSNQIKLTPLPIPKNLGAATSSTNTYASSLDNLRLRANTAAREVGQLAKFAGQVPPKVTTTFQEFGLTQAQKDALKLKSIYDGLDKRTVTTIIKTRQAKADFQLYGPGGIPHFGDGGIVTRPTVALVGERPEAIVPLDNNARRGASMVGASVGPQRLILDFGGRRTLTGWIEDDSRQLMHKEMRKREKLMSSGGVHIW